MSQENVETAYDVVAAYNRDGTEALLEYFDPDVELVAAPEWPEDRVSWGHAGIRKVMGAWNDRFDDFRVDPARVIDAGESGVVVLYTLHGRIKDSDRELVQSVGLRFEFRGDKITRWHSYLSWEQALKAVGLEE